MSGKKENVEATSEANLLKGGGLDDCYGGGVCLVR